MVGSFRLGLVARPKSPTGPTRTPFCRERRAEREARASRRARRLPLGRRRVRGVLARDGTAVAAATLSSIPLYDFTAHHLGLGPFLSSPPPGSL